MAETIFRAEKVTKEFPGVKALDEVSFELKKGEVHILLGENGAGKSTFIKLLSGVFPKDGGVFEINGEEVEIGSVHHAQKLGVTTIYQEMNLIPELTVAENIFLGREPKKGKLGIQIDTEEIEKRSRELLGSLALDIPPEYPVNELSVPQQQLVEVAKALSLEAKIIIFDEPTATLAEKETKALFRIIRLLKERGLGIIYISHRLEEVWQIGDRVTVLRDGGYVDTVKVAETDIDELIKMMVGRELGEQFPRTYREAGEVVLKLEGVGCGTKVHDIDMELRAGEIVGLAGLVGSGRTELAQTIFGIEKADRGSLELNGEKVEIENPTKATDLGLAFLTEDRKQLGLFQILTVKENILHAAMKRVFPRGIIKADVEKRIAGEYVEKLTIKTPTIRRLVKYLSGGNQQKVVLAKWLATEAKVFILDEPTRGIDVGAKQEIHRLMDDLVNEGYPILMISSELPEILGMSDRIYVMHEGTIRAEYGREEATQEKILHSAMGRG